MQTQQATPTVTRFLDSDYFTVIAEHIAAYPLAIAMVVDAALLGQYDAEMGLKCDPVARGYVKLADCEAYIIAWHDTATFWAATVDEFNDSIYADEPAIEDDYMFIAHGGA